MSAIDDLIARDSGTGSSASALDALLTSDSASPGAGAGRGSINPGLPSAVPSKLEAFGGGLGRGFGSTMLGLQQLVGNGLTSAADAMGDNGNTLSSLVTGNKQRSGIVGKAGEWLINDANQGLKKLDAEYAPLSEAHPIIAGTGNVGGQIGATMLPASLISKFAPAYTALGLGGRVALGAAQGAAGSAMMPVDPDSKTYWQDKLTQTGLGAGMGAAFPLVTAGLSAAGRGAWNVVQPIVQPERFVGQGITGAMTPAEAAQAAQNIRNAAQLVPGSVPTTAQAAQTPLLVQTEKASANLPGVKTGLVQRAIDNNAARWNALNGVAGTDAQLTAAQAARSNTAGPLYDAAHQATVQVGPAFDRFAAIPEVQQAMRAGAANANLDAAAGRGIAPVWPDNNSRAINGAALDYTSRALGDMINEAQRAGQNSRAASLTALRTQIDNFMGTHIPGVAQARAAYAAGSVPVNTMQAGQQIADTLGGRALNAAGAPDIQLAGYRTALGQALRGAEHGIDPAAEATLQGIQQDLQRASISNSIRSPGSDTAYNLAANGWLARQIYGPNFQGATGLGKTLAAGITALSGHPVAATGIFVGGNKVGQMVGSRLEGRLGNLLLEPNALLPYLDARAAASLQPVQSPLVQGLLSYGSPAVASGSLGLLGSLAKP